MSLHCLCSISANFSRSLLPRQVSDHSTGSLSCEQISRKEKISTEEMYGTRKHRKKMVVLFFCLFCIYNLNWHFLLMIVSLPRSSRLASGARGGWKEVTGRKKTPFVPTASINTEGVIRLVVYGSDRRFYENRLHDQTWQG